MHIFPRLGYQDFSRSTLSVPVADATLFAGSAAWGRHHLKHAMTTMLPHLEGDDIGYNDNHYVQNWPEMNRGMSFKTVT